MPATATFQAARRDLGVTAAVEERVLLALAARMPPWVNSDHLTALGLLALLVAGAAYARSGAQPAWLHGVNLLLLVNWFGDSLDGTVARYRRKQRPRYGFYVDHLVDAVGFLALATGLALSGLMNPAVAAGVVIAYYLMTLHVYLVTYTLGVFKIAYAGVGGTELRIVLGLVNLALFVWPEVRLGSVTLRLFDLAGLMAMGALLATFVVSSAGTVRKLYDLERV